MSKYKWLKTLKKFLWVAGYTIVAGVIVVFTEQEWFLVIIPVLIALQNFLKHKCGLKI